MVARLPPPSPWPTTHRNQQRSSSQSPTIRRRGIWLPSSRQRDHTGDWPEAAMLPSGQTNLRVFSSFHSIPVIPLAPSESHVSSAFTPKRTRCRSRTNLSCCRRTACPHSPRSLEMGRGSKPFRYLLLAVVSFLVSIPLTVSAALTPPTRSSNIPWRDHASLISVDGVGLFSVNGRSGSASSRYGPFYGPAVTDLAAFGSGEFAASTNNTWLVDGASAVVTQSGVSNAKDMLFGFSCSLNIGTRFFCTGGFGTSLTTTDIPLYVVDVKNKALDVIRFGFTGGSKKNTVNFVGRGFHASALIGTKLYMMGGMPCLFCSQLMWDVNNTAVIDVSNPARPTHRWLHATSTVPSGSKIDPLVQFAGSCAVTLPNGRALLIGGITATADNILQPLSNVLWTFDPNSQTYSPVMYDENTGPTPGWGMSCAMSSDRKSIFVHGGCDPTILDDASSAAGLGAPTDDAIYKLSVDSITSGKAKWTKIPSSGGAGPGPRCFASGAVYRDLFIVVGGQQPSTQNFSGGFNQGKASESRIVSKVVGGRLRGSKALAVAAVSRPVYRKKSTTASMRKPKANSKAKTAASSSKSLVGTNENVQKRASSSTRSNGNSNDQRITFTSSIVASRNTLTSALRAWQTTIAESLKQVLDSKKVFLRRRSPAPPHHGLFTPDGVIHDDELDSDDLITLDAADAGDGVSPGAGVVPGENSGFFVFNTVDQKWMATLSSLNIGSSPIADPNAPAPLSPTSSTSSALPTSATAKTATASATASVGTQSTPQPSSPSTSTAVNGGKSGLSTSVIIGIVIGTFTLAVLLAVGACLGITAWKRRKGDLRGSPPYSPPIIPPMTMASLSARAGTTSGGSPGNSNIFGFLNRGRSNSERRPFLAAPSTVRIKKPWKFFSRAPAEHPDRPDSPASRTSTNSFFVVRNPDEPVYTAETIPAGFSFPHTNEATAPEDPTISIVGTSASSDAMQSITPRDVAEAVRLDPASLAAPPVLARRATGRAKTVGRHRFLDPERNAIVPLLAPIQELVVPTDADPSSARPLSDIVALSAEFEGLIVNELGDLHLIPLDEPVNGEMGLEFASVPLRTWSNDAADPQAGVEVSRALQNEIRFQCMYCHRPRRPDELQLRYGDVVVLRKFYRDGWAYGINYSLQSIGGLFPIFCVEEADDDHAGSIAGTSITSPLNARYTLGGGVESEPVT
ncbi:hypothetical protein DFJ73DRAFT_819923 [Zopfochytrium polystomum]|nr:hypothetical protein DFJ73DRAFT_819923 [Zopfochytrium polystomum]